MLREIVCRVTKFEGVTSSDVASRRWSTHSAFDGIRLFYGIRWPLPNEVEPSQASAEENSNENDDAPIGCPDHRIDHPLLFEVRSKRLIAANRRTQLESART